MRRHEILRTTFAVVDGRYVQVIAPQLTVPLTFDDLRALPKSEEGDRRHTNSFRTKLLHSFDLAHGPLVRARLVRLAEQEHLLLITMHQIVVRRLVARRVRRRARHSLRRLLRREGIAPGAALNSVRRLCALAAALAVTSGHRCAARILARAAARSAARDEARHGPSETDNRRFPHGAARGGVAGEPVGGRQTLQPSRRRHLVHGARRRLEDAVASLPGSGRRASGHATSPIAIVRGPRGLSARWPIRSFSAPTSVAIPVLGR